VDSSNAFSVLLLGETETGDWALSIVKWDVTEAPGMTLEHLLLLHFHHVELHATVDGLASVWGGDGCQETPLLCGVCGVSDDLRGLFCKRA
jgi:hypothetical protein